MLEKLLRGSSVGATPMTDPKPFTIRTIRSDPPLELEPPGALRVVYSFGGPYELPTGRMVHVAIGPAAPRAVKPPTRFQQALDVRNWLVAADSMIAPALVLCELFGQQTPEQLELYTEIKRIYPDGLDAIDHLSWPRTPARCAAGLTGRITIWRKPRRAA